MEMRLEQVAKDLILLARKEELEPAHHHRARALMKELRMMGMTNAQVSELSGDRWAETTVKEYTRGVTVMDSQPWQSTTALLAEMLSRDLTTDDVRETMTVRDKLESEGTSFAEVTDLLVGLKDASIDVCTLVELNRDWRASGLTLPGAASILKYKGEIEASGFGLGSLSDIAVVSRTLGSPEEVLKAIEKYRDIEELSEQLLAAQRRLAEEDNRIKERIEEGEQAIKEVEEREQSIRDRVNELDKEVGAKEHLLHRADELEKVGLDVARLGDLYTAIVKTSAKHGLKPKGALRKFFSGLREYDAALGFEAEAERWEAIAETKKIEGEKARAQLDSLEMKYRERKEAVDATESLLKQGIKPDQIYIWKRILGRFKGPEQFDEELEHYKGMEEFLNTKAKEIERRELKVAELDARAKALKQELTEIQGSIKGLSTSGVREITALGDGVAAMLRRLAEATKKFGEVKAEAGKFEKELMHARYLTTTDEMVLKALPKEVVIASLERAATYCRLNQLNPLVKMPDDVSRKFVFISSSTGVPLLDLIAWAEAGLAGVSQ